MEEEWGLEHVWPAEPEGTEAAGASVEGAGASVEGAGASPLVQTPQRANKELEASVKTPLSESAEEQAGVSRKVQKVQPKLMRFFSPQPKVEDMELVKVPAVSSRCTPKACRSKQAEEALDLQVHAEKKSLGEQIADALAAKEQHLQIVGVDGSLAGVLGPYWGPIGAPLGPH